MSGNDLKTGENLTVEELEERKKRREAAKRKRLKRKKERIKKVCSVVLFVTIIIVGWFWLTQYPHKTISDNILVRDFTNRTVLIPKIPKNTRENVWDSELPYLVKNDFKEAQKKDYTIQYKIGTSNISIEFSSGKPVAKITSSESWALPSFNILSNFSIYKQGNNLYIYGFNEEYGKSFERYILFSDYSQYPKHETLTYDTNLPFSLEDMSIGTLTRGDYSLLYDKENSFYFYKDGQRIYSKKFSDPILTVDLYNGLLITENNMLYMIYAYLKDGSPELKFVYIDDGVSFANSESSPFNPYLKSSEKNDYLPILVKDGEYYTIIPNNWEDYTSYCIAEPDLKTYNRDTDYSATLVRLEDAFVLAKFEEKYSEWNVVISFNINGKIYTTDDYVLYGYDSRIDLSEEDVNQLSTCVKNIEEFKVHIQTIRDAYPKYYTIP